MTTTMITTVQTNLVQTTKPINLESNNRDLASRVAVVALGIISSAIIISTTPVQVSFSLVTLIAAATLSYALGPFEPSTSVSGEDDMEIVHVPRREVCVLDPTRTLFVRGTQVPVVISHCSSYEDRKITRAPDPSLHRPVGNREPRMNSGCDSSDSEPMSSHYESSRRENYRNPNENHDGEEPHRAVGSRGK